MHRLLETELLIGLRSALFHCLSAVVTLVSLLLFPLIWAPRRISLPVLSGFIWIQIGLLRVICGQSYRLVGQENVPDGPVILAPRHEAMWETLFLPVLFDYPIVFLKEEILRYPFAGPIAKCIGSIGLDRTGATDKTRASFALAKKLAQDGKSFLIFPSGTRNPEKRYNVEKGVAILYRALKLPVVPVVLDSGTFWPYKSWMRRPGVITIRVLPALGAGLRTNEFMAQLESDLAQPA